MIRNEPTSVIVAPVNTSSTPANMLKSLLNEANSNENNLVSGGMKGYCSFNPFQMDKISLVSLF